MGFLITENGAFLNIYKTFHDPLLSFFNLSKEALFLGTFLGFGGKAGREPPAGSSPYERGAGEREGSSLGAIQPEDEAAEAPSCRKCSLRVGSVGLPSKLPTKRATGDPRHTVLGAERKEKNRNAKLAQNNHLYYIPTGEIHTIQHSSPSIFEHN